jgi:hypothetical protein
MRCVALFGDGMGRSSLCAFISRRWRTEWLQVYLNGSIVRLYWAREMIGIEEGRIERQQSSLRDKSCG